MSPPAESPAEVGDALHAKLGAELVEAEAPVELEGLLIAHRVRPSDAEGLAEALRCLSDLGGAALVRGAGTRLAYGRPPDRADCVLELAGLTGVDEFDAEDGVVHARAGTPLAEIRARVEPEGWELPLDPPGSGTTLGGALATAASGPRLTGFGPPRDAVLGMEVTLANGERTRCGGRVVKNVTGYDIAKLYIGSLGTLGVVEGAWLRLRPQPAAVATYRVELADDAELFGRALELSRLACARVAAVMNPVAVSAVMEPAAAADPGRAAAAMAAPAAAGGRWVALLELAGDEAAVAGDARKLVDDYGAEPLAANAAAAESAPANGLPERGSPVEMLRSMSAAPDRLRARIDAAPTSLAGACSTLAARAGTAITLHPAVGRAEIEMCFEPESGGDSHVDSDGASARAAVAALRQAATAAGGHVVVEHLSLAHRRECDVFGLAPDTRSLMRALKLRFDPLRVLNPGRFDQDV